MELSKRNKNMMRIFIENEVKNVPAGMRIHLDKDLLEKLIFDEYDAKILSASDEELEGSTVKIKLVAWSGEFLSKIDLTEVSFDDVVWDMEVLHDCYEIDDFNENFDIYQDIYLSNTNAKIDFSKSSNVKIGCDVGYVSIVNCKLANVDLSNHTICGGVIKGSDLTNTGVNFDKDLKMAYSIDHSDLSGLDMSQVNVSELFFADDFVPTNNDAIDSVYCETDFSNTGLKINVVPISGEESLKYGKINELEDKESDIGDGDLVRCKNRVEAVMAVTMGINSGKLDGCYVNGILIKSPEDKTRIIDQILGDYKKVYSESISDITDNIEEQIKRFI